MYKTGVCNELYKIRALTGVLIFLYTQYQLMGAIAWHSQWIAGLYTWGAGEKEQMSAEAPAAEGQVPARERYKWRGGSMGARSG